MKLIREKEDDVIVIYVKGDLIEETGEEFREAIKKEINHDEKKIKIDLDKLAHIDEHGFDAMGSVISMASRNRVNITFYITEKSVYKKIKKSEYYEFIPISRNEGEAKKQLSRPLKQK